MKILLLALLVVLMPLLGLRGFAQDGSTAAAPATPCSAAQYRQFDFWIGSWNVTSGGKSAGTNRIDVIHNGCALQENWRSASEGGLVGSSFNIYDQASDRWHQSWVDSSGTLLQLDGGLENGVMVLSGQRPARDGSGTVQHRISWTPNPDGTVRQLWEVSKDEGDNWNVLFDGLYSPS